MKLRPLNDRILVRPDPPKEVTRLGLIIPAQALPRPDRGTVLAIGPGIWESGAFQPVVGLHEGDHVLYVRFGGFAVEIEPWEDDHEGPELVLLTSREIVAVEERDPEAVTAEVSFCDACGTPRRTCVLGGMCCADCSHRAAVDR